jgi:predicted dehydrogenase
MKKSVLSRREFISASALVAAGIASMPFVSCNGNNRFNDKIQLGFIGVGYQSLHLLTQLMKCPETVVVACSDVNSVNMSIFERKAKQLHEEKYGSALKIKTYPDFRDLIARKDIDAVVIATQDHWHAIIAVEAAKAGKDIYCEKPLASTVVEGRAMVNATRKYERVFQTGNMQRSSKEFRHACELVRNGYIGDIKEIRVDVSGPPVMFDIPVEETPKEINWDMWVGPAMYRGYNRIMAPVYKSGDKMFFPRWRRYKPYGGGSITDWGAHHFDIAQWGIGMDKSAPVKYLYPKGPAATSGMKMEYSNGIVMHHGKHREKGGILFVGTEGTVQVNRGFLATEPASLKELTIKDSDIHLELSTNHYQNWIDAIISRENPICDVAIGHSTSALCNVVNIAYDLERDLEWDPAQEKFVNDDEANSLLSRPYRGEWKLEV